MALPDYPRVNVIVLHWKNYAQSKRCLESLRQATYPNLSVIVVDNGSGDGSGRRLQNEFSDYRYVFNERNLGFARGCNVGIREALKDAACSYIVLLNNDAEVSAGFLEPAVQLAEADKSIGAISGKILLPTDRRIWYAGGWISILRGQAITPFGAIDRGQYDQIEEVGFVTGALMLIRRRVLETVGLLAEEYFFGVEEWDFSLTVRRAGWKLFYVPEFLIFHRGDGSHFNWDPKFVYNNYRNKLIFQQKFLPRAVFPLWKFFYVAYLRHFRGRSQRRWLQDHAYLGLDAPPADTFDYALSEALRDHNRIPLSEEALHAFAERFKNRFESAPA
jgi:GT2 family glycosyltransferase